MKYTNKVEIDLPIQKVIELWKDESNYPEWQKECKRQINHVLLIKS